MNGKSKMKNTEAKSRLYYAYCVINNIKVNKEKRND
jgi:hypothetical protein